MNRSNASSTGFAEGLSRPTTLLVGDLSFLHDINGLNLLRGGELRPPLTVVLVNNSGAAAVAHYACHAPQVCTRLPTRARVCLPCAWHEGCVAGVACPMFPRALCPRCTVARTRLPALLPTSPHAGGGIFSFLPIAASVPEDEFTPLWATPQNVDLEAMCRAQGIPHQRVTQPDGLERALRVSIVLSMVHRAGWVVRVKDKEGG